jgi:hypothetical protein
MDPSELLGENYLKNKDKIDMLRKGVCFGLCTCDVENVDMSNIVVIDATAQAQALSEEDIKNVANQTVDELSKTNYRVNHQY